MPKKAFRYTIQAAVVAWISTAKAAHWWWRLPDWVKGLKIIIIVAVAIGLPLVDTYHEYQNYRKHYETYYKHFHADYVTKLDAYKAHKYADFYADFYAKYYTNPAFRKAYDESLPSATQENIQYPSTSVNARLRTDQRGLNLVKEFEGLRLEPYHDAVGLLTIGYGHLIKPDEFYTALNEQQAEALLRKDLMVAEAFVKRYVTVQLSSGEFSALVSLVYNIGPGNFKRSTLLSQLNKGRKDRAAREFLRWDKAGGKTLRGLSRRREAEKALFEAG